MLKKLVSSKFFIPWQQWTQQQDTCWSSCISQFCQAENSQQTGVTRYWLFYRSTKERTWLRTANWGTGKENQAQQTDQADFLSKMTSSNISTGLAETSRTLVHPYSSLKPSDSAMHENTKTCVWINWCKSSELKNGNFKYLAQKALCSPEGVQQWSKLATPFQVWWGSFATAVRDAVNTEIKWCTMWSSHLRNKQHHREIK